MVFAVWQVTQLAALPWDIGKVWLTVDGFQADVLWQDEHWPRRWLAGREASWQDWQSVA